MPKKNQASESDQNEMSSDENAGKTPKKGSFLTNINGFWATAAGIIGISGLVWAVATSYSHITDETARMKENVEKIEDSVRNFEKEVLNQYIGLRERVVAIESLCCGEKNNNVKK